MSAVNISASIPIIFSVSAFPYPSATYTYPQGSVKIKSTANGARILVNGSDLGLDISDFDLATLAEFLNDRLKPGNGLGLWTVIAASSNWTLKYNGTSTGISVSRFVWDAVGQAIWSYLG